VICVVSGGVGAARLLRALRAHDPQLDLEAVVNVGDDLVLHGLTICPDLDTITYTLAGLNDEQRGWGLRDETWRVRDRLAELDGAAWFSLGDLDLATHLYRSQRLAEGATKTDVTDELRRRLGVDVRLWPVTDDQVATEFDTAIGPLSFQDYFVRHRHAVEVRRVHCRGAEHARLSEGAKRALLDAERIVIAPSNPLISIDPILRVPGVRELLMRRRDDVVAVSPLVGGAALKGPADRLMRELGWRADAVGVAEFYRGVVGTMVMDQVDASLADEVAATGCRVRVTTTVMSNSTHAAALAETIRR
jgi:LPPG:FO 2-phospho-L-lactate transferase